MSASTKNTTEDVMIYCTENKLHGIVFVIHSGNLRPGKILLQNNYGKVFVFIAYLIPECSLMFKRTVEKLKTSCKSSEETRDAFQ